MKKIFIFLLLALELVANAQTNVAKHLQDISVTIRAANSEGSGVLFTRRDANSNSVNLILTAAHVVADLRSTRDVISSDGSKRVIVEFRDVKIIKELVENGRTIGRLELDAEVIKYSDADSGNDLALLKLRKKDFIKDSVKYYLDDQIPEIGTELLHVGSLLGSLGANSMTSGILSAQGRLINKNVYDQGTIVSFPGSSGGGVFLKDGKYVGQVQRGAGETFTLICPIRRVIGWAKIMKLEWAFNPDVPMPSDEDIRKIPIEDSGSIFDQKVKTH